MASFFQTVLGFLGVKTKGQGQKQRTITPMRKQLSASMKPVAMVTHFYDKPSVGVITLNEGKLCVGDKIRVTNSDHYFDQTVDSLQVEHKPVQEITAGMVAGLRMKEKIRDGELIFKI